MTASAFSKLTSSSSPASTASTIITTNEPTTSHQYQSPYQDQASAPKKSGKPLPHLSKSRIYSLLQNLDERQESVEASLAKLTGHGGGRLPSVRCEKGKKEEEEEEEEEEGGWECIETSELENPDVDPAQAASEKGSPRGGGRGSAGVGTESTGNVKIMTPAQEAQRLELLEQLQHLWRQREVVRGLARDMGLPIDSFDNELEEGDDDDDHHQHQDDHRDDARRSLKV
ncbi:hypothetical protein IE53DRAFT_389723 [Violaceomyces palustris]|uniref:Uncharacterized protein n=1 Tax=Violaceomyces palustris TaxID=1673888 RepID=A0ACD0NQN4_9BASI|nr:hypothetical protein IE53DRAFT_389723 [Violaceomyces palustris]